MAKTLTEAKIAGRADRKRLAISAKPYWRGIDPDVHLGYRKGKRGGVWLVRWRDGGPYRQQGLGTADDEIHEGTLDFESAVRAACAVVESERRQTKATADGPLLTVQSAIEAYISIRDKRDTARKGQVTRSDASSRLGRHVIGRLASGKRKAIAPSLIAAVPLHELTEDDLAAWRGGLSPALQRATKQRLINDLKAALNEAYAANRNRLPSILPATIKYGLRDIGDDIATQNEIARDNQILSDEQVAVLVSAAQKIDAEQGWEGDLFRLVLVLAATGSRMSQIIRMRVGDVQVASSRLMVPVSRKGKGSKNPATPVVVGEDVLQALMPVVEGRPASAPLLERWRNKQVPGSVSWERGERGPWSSSSELTRPWNAIKDKANLPNAIPYAFRHSSIVRGLRVNNPIRLVAARHDTSVQMIERHYGRFIVDVMDEVSLRAIVPLVRTAS